MELNHCYDYCLQFRVSQKKLFLLLLKSTSESFSISSVFVGVAPLVLQGFMSIWWEFKIFRVRDPCSAFTHRVQVSLFFSIYLTVSSVVDLEGSEE